MRVFRALEDIDEIERYSVRRCGDRVAQKYIEDLGAALDRLRQMPSLLQSRPEHLHQLRFYRVREHLLVYDMISDRIFVLAVMHGGMNLPKRIANLEPQLAIESQLLHARIAGVVG